MAEYRIIDTPEDGKHQKHKIFPLTVVDQWGRERGIFPNREAADEKIAELLWHDSLPVGQQTSGMLTEVRTVHSRAKDAICGAHRGTLDPQGAEILADLEKVVELLDRWQRTGRTPKMPKSWTKES